MGSTLKLKLLIKNMFIFVFKKYFLKKIILFIFLNYFFFVFLNHFNILMSKIILKI